MKKVIQQFDLSENTLTKYLNEGYELKFVVPETNSYYNATQFVTRMLYILVNENAEVDD